MNDLFGKPSGALRWLSHRDVFDVSLIISFGYHAIDLAASYGSGAMHNWPRFDFELYKALIPGDILDWNPEAARTQRPPAHYLESFLFLDRVLRDQDQLIPFQHGSLGQIRSWLQAELALLGQSGKADDQIFSDPERLITAGYQILPHPGEREPLDSRRGVVGLALVGLGADWFWSRERCEICFRLQSPGLFRCSLHSQSKFNVGDDPRETARRVQFSRVARKAIFADSGLSKIMEMGRGSATFEHAVASILWPSIAANAFFDVDRIESALNAAPRVRRLLPNDFKSLSPAGKMSVLREKIDPEERVADVWPEKIREAETWLVAEAAVAPGRRYGLSPTNKERVAQIKRFLEQGISKAAIAKHLGISRSYLSHLLRRANGRGKS